MLFGNNADFHIRNVQWSKMLMDFPRKRLGLEHRHLNYLGTILEARKELPAPALDH